MRYLLLLFLLPSMLLSQRTLSGTVTEAGSGEPLMGVNVYVPATGTGVQTNAYGFYSLPLADTTVPVIYSYLGYASDTVRQGRGSVVDVALRPSQSVLTTVEVRVGSRVRGTEVSQLSLQTVNELPVLFGEKDIMKGLQLLPGVSNPREGFGGLYVRGGSPDQNLILLDGAPVYNAYHLFGFLSVFNADALQRVTLYKGNFPARYGGRTAAVVDVRMKEGNRSERHGSGGIGLLTSRLTLEGPLGKGKRASFLVSGRRTYADLLLGLVTPKGEKRTLHFYDGSFKLNYALPRGDRFYLSGYTGRDAFGSAYTRPGGTERDGFDWGNRTLTARYNRVVGERAFLNITALYTKFDFTVTNEQIVRDTLYGLEYFSGIQDAGITLDLDLYLGAGHTLRFGAVAVRHDFTLAALSRRELGADESVATQRVRAPEYALYAEDEWQLSDRVEINYGLRLSLFAPVSGPIYAGVGPRLSFRYRYSPALHLTLGYARTTQYLHLLSNSGPGLPTSLWVPASNRMPPQRGQQWSAGTIYQRPASPWTFAAGLYYRRMRDLLGYRNGATFLLLDVFDQPERSGRTDLIDNVTTGSGRAYGSEWSGNYQSDRLRLNLAYTLAWVSHRLAGVNAEKYFAANQDRRHDFTLSGSWQWRPDLLLTAAWSYGSGVPTTVPNSIYSAPVLPGFTNTRIDLDHHTERNGYRIPAVHRLDLALQWKRHPRWGEAYWELGCYNAYARANPFFVETRYRQDRRRVLTKTALFPLIPSVAYNFSF
ncbi:hypothetical protein LEM8419_00789 [Neolewinella maritima]|uniref:TonB-dependent receptor n=1 Tax=Neolewinella maritima TaxID=1383882 RepID=A0ABM9AZ55_9BACT|nr:TonB-dependent receptor [Neolewinella maritima]CAH0999489.1 hypothetical protein LEM8419_00789 [Neolewinella maritima]